MSMVNVQVRAANPCPIVHAAVHVHATSPCSWCMFMPMQQGHRHAAQTRACSLGMDTKHVLWHAAWTWTCSMDTNVQHGHELQHGHEYAIWTSCNMDIMQHGHGQGQAVCNTCPWCMPMSNVHAPAVCQCPCSMSLSMLLVQIHVARTWTRSREMTCSKTWSCSMEMLRSIYWDKQYGHWHPAWTWTCSMNMNMESSM
jgi:hypothetical protein